MKFEIQQEVFAEMLDRVSAPATSSKTSDSTSNVGLKVLEEKTLNFYSGNASLNAYTATPTIDNAKNGTVSLQFSLLSQLIKKLPKDIVKVEVKDDFCFVNCRNIQAKLPINNQELALVKDDKELVKFKIPSIILAAELNMVKFCTSKDTFAYNLSGVLFHYTKNELNIVATDGKRLAISSIDITDDKNDIRCLIAGTAINEVCKLCNKDSGDTLITIRENSMQFLIGDSLLTVALLKSDYPDYTTFTAINPKNSLKVKSKEILDAIKRSAILKTDLPIIKLNIDKDSVSVSNHNQFFQINEVIKSKSNEKCVIGINAQYLIDILNIIEDEIVEIKFENEKTPLIINLEGYTYLMLPFQI